MPIWIVIKIDVDIAPAGSITGYAICPEPDLLVRQSYSMRSMMEAHIAEWADEWVIKRRRAYTADGNDQRAPGIRKDLRHFGLEPGGIAKLKGNAVAMWQALYKLGQTG